MYIDIPKGKRHWEAYESAIDGKSFHSKNGAEWL